MSNHKDSSIDEIDQLKDESAFVHSENIDEASFDEHKARGLAEEQLAELDKLAEQEVANRSLWRRILLFEFILNFKDKNSMVTLLGVFSAFAGLLSGLDQSLISGAMVGIRNDLDMHGENAGRMAYVAALMPLGAMAGAIMLVPLNYAIGRRSSIVVSCLWYTIGAILCAAAQNYQTMYAGRFILGIGVGIEGGCVGVYIGESVPRHRRGDLISAYQGFLAFGEMIGFMTGAIFFDVHGGWRFMLGSSLVFSTLLLIGLYFLPESPRWLVSKNLKGEAWLVWQRLRNADDLDSQVEFLELIHVVERDENERKQENAFSRYLELITIPRNRRAVLYAITLVALGQLVGINSVMYYLATVMRGVGFDDRRSVHMSIVGGASLFLGSIPALLWMDKYGRRVWAQNVCGFFIGLVLMGAGSRVDLDTNRSAAMGVSLTGIILYMAFYGTYACLTWVVPAESFGLRTRSQGMSCCSVSLYFFAFLMTFFFERMVEKMTFIGVSLGFFGGICVITFVFQILFMPETKGKTLEEIDELFSMPTHRLIKHNLDYSARQIHSVLGRNKVLRRAEKV